VSPTKRANKAAKAKRPNAAKEPKQRVHVELPWPLYLRAKEVAVQMTKRLGYHVAMRDIFVPAIENHLENIRNEGR